MTIIETMARELCKFAWPSPHPVFRDREHFVDTNWPEYVPEARAALRAVKPSDISDAQLEAFTRVMPAHYLPKSKYADDLRRAAAALINAGAE